MMGLSNWLHWLAWFAKCFLFSLISVTLVTIIIKVTQFFEKEIRSFTSVHRSSCFSTQHAVRKFFAKFQIAYRINELDREPRNQRDCELRYLIRITNFVKITLWVGVLTSFWCTNLPIFSVVSVGNSMVLSAITDKHARVSFFKDYQNSTTPKDECYLRSLKNSRMLVYPCEKAAKNDIKHINVFPPCCFFKLVPRLCSAPVQLQRL